jgi:quercetin dioxygenase-like cupin family protein
LRLSLYEHPRGVETAAGNRVVYDVERGEAFFGAATVHAHALVWELGHDDEGALFSRQVDLDPATPWIARCDRIDFPPGGIAYMHTHPGPGIRYLLHGELQIRTLGKVAVYGPGGIWFEQAGDPILATASPEVETAFVRVLLLPAEWEDKRTIRYVDPGDEEKPKLQRPTVFFDHALALP